MRSEAGTVVDVSAPRRRPALIALVTIAALTCLALGWWQWSVFQEARGTFQNLGYSLQWPLFAGFFIYTYRRYVRLEAEHAQESGEAKDQQAADRAAPTVTAIPDGLLPTRPTGDQGPVDPVRAEYNRQLAELYARDADRSPE